MNTTFTQLREYVIEATKIIKHRFSTQTSESEFHFEISAIGRVDGDVRVKFKIADGYYNNQVEGGDLDAVLDEYIRRKGWSKRNNALLLGNTGSVGEAHED